MGVQIWKYKSRPQQREASKPAQTQEIFPNFKQLWKFLNFFIFWLLLPTLWPLCWAGAQMLKWEENVFPIISRNRHGPAIFLTLLRHKHIFFWTSFGAYSHECIFLIWSALSYHNTALLPSAGYYSNRICLSLVSTHCRHQNICY